MRDNGSVLPALGRLRTGALALAGFGGLAAIVGYFVDSRQFFNAYIFAYVFWIGLALGCLGLTMLQHVVQASWGRPVLRIFEAGNRTLPMMLLLFVPVFFGMSHLYHWIHPHGDEILEAKAPYLNVPFFLIRFVLYFAIWIGLATILNRSSLKQDQTGDVAEAAKRSNISAPGIVVFVITLTFAFTDWVMSLDPHWFSTIYGLWFLVGQGMSAMALAVLLIVGWHERRPYAGIVTPQLTRDLGNLLLMFTMLWAYLTLSQFLIIWSGNLPEETTYYVNRGLGGMAFWNIIGGFLVFFQFFAPFLILLSGRTKRTPHYLIKVAGWILFMRVVDTVWTIVPFFNPSGYGTGMAQMGQGGIAGIWIYLATFLGIGGIWLAVFATELRRHPLLVRHEAAVRGAEVLEHA